MHHVAEVLLRLRALEIIGGFARAVLMAGGPCCAAGLGQRPHLSSQQQQQRGVPRTGRWRAGEAVARQSAAEGHSVRNPPSSSVERTAAAGRIHTSSGDDQGGGSGPPHPGLFIEGGDGDVRSWPGQAWRQ